MKKVLSWILSLSLSFLFVGCSFNNNSNISSTNTISSSSALEIKQFQFGLPEKIKFGMKESEVIAIAGDDYLEYEELIVYDFSKGKPFVGDKMYYTSYGFSSKNKLQYISYTLTWSDDQWEHHDVYAAYQLLQETLQKEHGDYTSSKIDWYDKKYKDDSPSWNKAFRLNQAKATTKWIFDDYMCELVLDDNGVHVSYNNSKLRVLYDNFIKKINRYNENIFVSDIKDDIANGLPFKAFTISDSEQKIDIEVRINDNEDINSTAIVDADSSSMDLFVAASIYILQLSDKSLSSDLIKETLPKLIGDFQKNKETTTFENHNINVLYNINEKRGVVLLIENK